MKWLWNKILLWFLEEYELTVYFPGKTDVMPDGSRIESVSPKTYKAKKIVKLKQTHIIFVDLDNQRHEIKVVNPVGYDLKKIY